jgi:hypothetical protein
MSNGSRANTHVTEVLQRGDNTISVHIQTDSFKPGQEVEVSAYLTQGNSSSFHNDKKHIPFPKATDLPNATDLTKATDSKQSAELHAELPVTALDVTLPVTVVTRVTEIWSTVVLPDADALKQYQALLGEYGSQGIKGVWTYPDSAGNQDSEGKGPGGSESPSTPPQ